MKNSTRYFIHEDFDGKIFIMDSQNKELVLKDDSDRLIEFEIERKEAAVIFCEKLNLVISKKPPYPSSRLSAIILNEVLDAI